VKIVEGKLLKFSSSISRLGSPPIAQVHNNFRPNVRWAARDTHVSSSYQKSIGKVSQKYPKIASLSLNNRLAWADIKAAILLTFL